LQPTLFGQPGFIILRGCRHRAPALSHNPANAASQKRLTKSLVVRPLVPRGLHAIASAEAFLAPMRFGVQQETVEQPVGGWSSSAIGPQPNAKGVVACL